MITIKGNILAVKQGFVCYPVDHEGFLRSSLAKSLSQLWPKVSSEYMTEIKRGDLKLGEVLFTTVRFNKLYIASLCTETRRNLKDDRCVDYPAIGSCLRKVKDWYDIIGRKKLPVYIPYKMSCSQAGGDWEIVENIIKREIPKAIIIKLEY